MKSCNLQEFFLNYIRKEKIIVQIYLINGVQLRGIVRGFDSFTIVLENEGKQSIVYKHAISTLVPAVAVKFSSLNVEQNEDIDD